MIEERNLLFYGLGLVTIWDGFTTIKGTSDILGGTGISFFLGILFALLITSFLIKTVPIMFNPRKDFLHEGAKLLWLIAVIYDLFTSFMGNKELVASEDFGFAQFAVSLGLTIFVCSSPIILSFIIHKDLIDNLSSE